jgi:hypothetical protein
MLNPVTRHRPNKIAGLLGLQGRPIRQWGICLQQLKEQQKKDIIKIGTADVVIQEDNKGPIIFGESANTTKKDMATIKTADPKYSMPRWCPAGLTRSQKQKLQRLRAKESQEKEAEKIFNDTHPQYLPPQKNWRPTAVEEKQTATLVQHPAGMADSSTSKAGQSASGTDRPSFTRKPPDNLHQARTVRPLCADRLPFARKPPTTRRHQWKRMACWEKT